MSQPSATFDTRINVAELDPQRPRLIETPWGVMALYKVVDDVLCGSAFCPHLEGPLFEGTLSGATITCPWHQWRFDLRTGRRLALFGAPLPGPRMKLCGVDVGDDGAIVLRAPTDA